MCGSEVVWLFHRQAAMYRDRDDYGGGKGGAEHLARIHGTEEDKVRE
jgi:hypothetical protein